MAYHSSVQPSSGSDETDTVDENGSRTTECVSSATGSRDHDRHDPSSFHAANNDRASSTGTVGSTRNNQRSQSKPIAIKRFENHAPLDNRAQDEDDDALENAEDRVPFSMYHQSLPARLLHAPLLGAVRNNNDYLIQQISLPPPMSLLDQDDDGKMDMYPGNYGSLRDSHMHGRFLNGANSTYRDQTTTSAYRSQNISSLGSVSVGIRDPVQNGLSIGERIQRQRRVKEKVGNTNGLDHISSLAALMESSALSDGNHGSPVHTAATELNGSNLQDLTSEAAVRNDIEMMSTSLTGLQILQRGLSRYEENDPLRNLSSLTEQPSRRRSNDPKSTNEDIQLADVHRKRIQQDAHNSLVFAADNGRECDSDVEGAFDFEME